MTSSPLGFTKIEALNLDISSLMAAINRSAADRNLRLDIESDALDMSRDLMLDEAFAPLGGRWDITADTLRVWPSWAGDVWPIGEGR